MRDEDKQLIAGFRDALADSVIIIKRGQEALIRKIEEIEAKKDMSKEEHKESKKTSQDAVLSQIKGVERAVNNKEVVNDVSINNPEAITEDLKAGLEKIVETLITEFKNSEKNIVVENDLSGLTTLMEESQDKKSLIEALKKIEDKIKEPELTDYTPILSDISIALGAQNNDDVINVLKDILVKDHNIEFPEIMAVDLDPNLIEDNRIKTVLPDEQVAKMATAFQSGRMGGATDISQLSRMMTRVASDSSDVCIVYTGQASVASDASKAVWKITRYDESVDEIAKFADSGNFSQIWDDRESLSYE